MRSIHSGARQPNSVRATFEDGASSFLFPSDATLEELAGRLGHLAEQRRSRPLAFEVKLGSLSHRPRRASPWTT